jgi:hypothetical protein
MDDKRCLRVVVLATQLGTYVQKSRNADGEIRNLHFVRAASIGSKPCFTHVIIVHFLLLTAKLTAKVEITPEAPC